MFDFKLQRDVNWLTKFLGKKKVAPTNKQLQETTAIRPSPGVPRWETINARDAASYPGRLSWLHVKSSCAGYSA